MFEYDVVDWAEILGLVIPFALISYLAIVPAAKILGKIFRYDFNKEWPRHWKAILLSFLTSPGVLAFAIIRSEDQKLIFDRYLALGELPGSTILWIGGIMGVLIAVSVVYSWERGDT